MKIIDDSYGATDQSYQLTRVYADDGLVVRVRVKRDSYIEQSYAVAEVLTPGRTWTEVVNAPASQWHPKTPRGHSTEDPMVELGLRNALAPMAARLAERAATVLAAIKPDEHSDLT